MKTKINIIHLASFPFFSGGIDTWLYNFIEYNKDNFEITLFCPMQVGKLEKHFNIDNFDNLSIQYLPSFNSYISMVIWSIKSAFILHKEMNTQNPIIVLSTIPTMMPIFLLKLFSKLKKSYIICSVRGNIAQDAIDLNKSLLFQKAVFYLEKIMLKTASIIIANGWDTQKYLMDFFAIQSVVIPNGFIGKNLIHNQDDNNLDHIIKLKESGQKIILHVGTLRPIKGIDYIIKACNILIKLGYKNYSIIFVGKGQIEKYKAITTEFSIPAIYVNEKKNVADYFELADVVINVSGGSGISNSLIEAMSIGKTVVAWNTHTFNQVIINKKNGYLVDKYNSEHLAECLYNILANDKGLEDQIIKESVRKFDWDEVNNKFIRILTDYKKY